MELLLYVFLLLASFWRCFRNDVYRNQRVLAVLNTCKGQKVCLVNLDGFYNTLEVLEKNLGSKSHSLMLLGEHRGKGWGGGVVI